jgi:ABC-type polysaccharide transport system permease subunit
MIIKGKNDPAPKVPMSDFLVGRTVTGVEWGTTPGWIVIHLGEVPAKDGTKAKVYLTANIEMTDEVYEAMKVEPNHNWQVALHITGQSGPSVSTVTRREHHDYQSRTTD